MVKIRIKHNKAVEYWPKVNNRTPPSAILSAKINLVAVGM
jgi:hypothetical protein